MAIFIEKIHIIVYIKKIKKTLKYLNNVITYRLKLVDFSATHTYKMHTNTNIHIHIYT